MTELLDCIVVGYGPVGAVMAGLLGQAGVQTAVFESTTSVYHLPRAAHLDAEVMRVLRQLGVADEVLLACAPVKGMHFINADGDALLRFDAAPGQGWMFYQPDLERALRNGVAREVNVDVHLAHEVAARVGVACERREIARRDRALGDVRVREHGLHLVLDLLGVLAREPDEHDDGRREQHHTFNRCDELTVIDVITPTLPFDIMHIA